MIKLNNKGSGFIQLPFLVLTIISFYLLSTELIKKHFYIQQNLVQAKECLSQLVDIHQKYNSYIKKTNDLILATHLGKMLPSLAPFSGNIRKLIQYSQEVMFLSYLFNLSSSSFCRIEQYSKFSSPKPYERSNGFFKREKTGTVKIKKTTYSISLCFKKSKLLIRVNFNSKKDQVIWIAKERDTCR